MTLDDCKEEASFGGQQTDLISKTKENQLIPKIVTIFWTNTWLDLEQMQSESERGPVGCNALNSAAVDRFS